MSRRAVLLLAAAGSALAACPDQTDQAACAGAGCLWNTLWAPNLCTSDPCKAKLNQQTCTAVAQTVPFPCSAPAGDPDFCIVPVCHYDARAQVPCQLAKCLSQDAASCGASAQCTWKAPKTFKGTEAPSVKVGYCVADYCAGLAQTVCQSQSGCKWGGSTCTPTSCGEHPDELGCTHDAKCQWDATAVCKETVCGAVGTQGPCNTNTKCMWDTKRNACIAKTCDKYNHPADRCKCSEDTSCTWHEAGANSFCTDPKFNTCPDLDIAFVLDGSGSMRRSFGRHPHGFYGLMEILREWMTTVPLTGDDHTVGAAAKTNTGAFRMTFIQFSMAEARPDQDHPVGCVVGQCTSGLLSGRRDELQGDITWHEENYQAQWTYLHDALKDVADHTFLPTQSPPGRQHVVIIIADGGITDIDGDACCETRCGDRRCIDRNWLPRYPTMLNDAQAKLRSEGVTVFGIVMRRFDYHTFQDDNAQAKLTPLVSTPTNEHFMNLMLDEIPTKVLNTLCDPNSKFGKKVVKKTTGLGCAAKDTQACGADAACQWDDAKAKCGDSSCYPLCTQQKCDANTLCKWSGSRCDLKPPGCTAKDQTQCKADPKCLWNPLWADKCIDNPCLPKTNRDSCVATATTMPAPCDTSTTNVDFCKLEVCDFDDAKPECNVKKCLQVSKDTCEKEPGCVWTGKLASPPATVSPADKVNMCSPKPCTHTQQADCTKDPLCKWDNTKKCVVTDECKRHTDELKCDKDAKCHWDVKGAPAVCTETPCAKHSSKTPCDTDGKCMWAKVNAVDVCVPKTCDKHTAKCPCDTDKDCVWHHGPQGAFCTTPKFNTCPDLDIAFVLDGSGSMRRSFGRHPHGFYGLMELLREWMTTVPLTGDDHTVGAAAKTNTGAFRMTFIQFSMAEARPDQDHPMGCAVGQCTNGLLSGRRDELQGDITWHEDNYQAQWTYLHDALKDVADHTFLPTQSPPGRQHVVIIIADGGITDIDGDACCETQCGDPRCVDRRWKPTYPKMLNDAQAKLRSEGVTVFGIVMRRFDYHTFQDDNAQAKLTPLVSTPTDTHFMNLMLDEIPSKVLNTLCDPNSKFGQVVVQKPPGCAAQKEELACVSDKACVWDKVTASPVCKESVCYPLCTETDCKKNPACDWKATECVQKPPGCLAKDQTQCKADKTCLWNPLWADKCIDNPCLPPTKETDCHAVGVTMPVPCNSPAADPDFCKLDVCQFDAKQKPSCEVKKCLQVSKDTCEKEPGCVWTGKLASPPATVSPTDKVNMCSPKPCTHTQQADCTKDPLCKWDTTKKCVVTDECKRHADALKCDKDAKCHWDVKGSPAVCTETPCAKHSSKTPCDTDGKCMWAKVNAVDVCVPKTCDKHTAKCPCDTDKDCVWHHGPQGAFCTTPKFNTCPDLDIAFVLDGSGSMRRSFGRHPHGFYGLMELLREWMTTVPLTGDDHTAGAAGASRGKGFRMTFIQFSMAEARPDQDHPMGCAVGQCTNGLLSGRRDELQGDITWHEENYQAQWTYLHDALKDVADHTFLPTQSPSWRQHVVIIIADGGITDIDGDACCEDSCGNPRCVDRRWKPTYPKMLNDAQAKLRSEGVTVFGIVMRRFDYHTFQDDNAQAKLTPLVSEPSYEHFMNLMLDEIPSKVLNTLCDANSKFGKVVVGGHKTGCAVQKEAAVCVSDKACVWDKVATPAVCKESVCYPLCTETDCKKNPACDWKATECVQKPPGCLAKDQTQCKADKTCLWDPLWADKCIDNPCLPPTKETDCHAVGVTMPVPCDAPAADPDFCKLDVCQFDAKQKPSCEVKKCLQVSKDTCEKEPGCVWTGKLASPPATVSPTDKVNMCSPKPCSHTQQADCTKDPLCKWDNTKKCVVTDECKRHTDELKCDKDAKCHWDVKGSPAVCTETPCAKHSSKTPCDADGKCMWAKVNAVDVCVPKTCDNHKERCPCQTDKDCVWHHGPQGGFCTIPKFNTCPDLDIAFVLDGSGSMRRSFGRHPHGFYGLMELLREWMTTVPLTGDDHTVGAAAKTNTGAFRMTFIQFSMAEARPDQDHPVGCVVGQCTSGLLSGRRDELQGDITWHEDKYQAQWTYLHDALMDVADHTFLPTQSPPGRQHVVIIIADGGITDIDGDACCETQCGDPRCVDRRWKPTYPGILNEAQTKLRSEGVTVFGIVMRRFDYHTFQDDNAQTKLTPLVSNPRSDHFMNLMLDEIPSKVLNTLCDPNSKFGKKVAQAPPTCKDLKTVANCSLDTACVWDATKLSCGESECYPLCTKADCDTNTKCFWGGKECKLTPITPAPATSAPSTAVPPTPLPATPAPPTSAPVTPAPPTPAPATPAPPTAAPPTPAPTPVPTPEPPIDECKDAATNQVCKAKAQLCRDPDHKKKGDWECLCPPPSKVLAVGKAVADCSFDECKQKDVVCVQQGQKCKDTDLLKKDTWQCECVPPQTGTPAPMTPAVCKDPPGDCEVNGATCHAAGQTCVAGANDKDGKFECACMPPSKGANGANAPAQCVLDECKDVCPTCAKTKAAGTNVCEAAGQDCEDLNTGHANLRDWRCKCKPPMVGAKTTAPADCTMDECKVKCPTCADTGSGNICTKAGQTCVEHDVRNTSDWECVCVDPKVGRALAAVATCTEDECRSNEKVCVAAGQTCIDTDPTKAGSWKCQCPPPSKTVSLGAAAVCEEDECKVEENKKKCADVGQTCVDPDLKTKDSWECHCPPPSTGKQRLGAVVPCQLDECKVVCPTCASTDKTAANVCEAKNQTCHDPITTAASVSDWTCTCKGSGKSAVTAPVAQCQEGKDECVEYSSAVTCAHVPRYTKDGCLCACGWTATFKDHTGKPIQLPPGPGASKPCDTGCCNPQADPSGDWCYLAADDYNKKKPECSARRQSCVAAGQVPADGGKPSAQKPVPGIPSGQSNKCTEKGQLCVDPNKLVTDDWQCKCVPPKTGAPGMQVPAVCVEDECTEHAAVCLAMNQRCVDPNTASNNDWYCECTVGPAKKKVGGVAVCVLDECTEVCPTCATDNSTDVCAAVGQVCEDPKQTDTSLGDWVCKCAPPAVGSNVGGPVARCLLDECALACPTCAYDATAKKTVCEKKGQTCEDPNKDAASTNDWRCKCPPPSHTLAVANTAVCEEDECEANGKVCLKGQQCVDPDQLKKDDWYCECVAPAKGSQVKGPAVCEEDECKTKGSVCAKAGQTCKDHDVKKLGNWFCECIAPDRGVAGAQKPAKCLPPDVCKEGGEAVCSAAGQHCEKAPGGTKFQCACIAPYTGAAVVGKAAVCTLDECATVCPSCQKTSVKQKKGVCELHDQVCEDPDKTKTGDWVCKCKPPAHGNALVGAAAVCVLDECKDICPTCEKDVCSAKGQTCVDPSTSPLHVSDWMCKCPPPSTNTRTGAPVPECMFDECTQHTTACAAAGQVCVDPDTKKTGDWECHCSPPASGSASKGPAGTCTLNECTAQCPTCADSGKGNVCLLDQQVCVDPDHATPSNWICQCPEGSSFKVGGVVPKCMLNECKEVCPTCADKGGGNICERDGQTCHDKNTEAYATGDWQCRCPPPLQDKFATAGLAVCGLDECTENVNGTIPGAICGQAGQACHDSHLGTLGDFDCVCVKPRQGTKTGGPALCTTDECLVHGDKCGKANQTCIDRNLTALNDWECVCPPPSSNVQQGAVAVRG